MASASPAASQAPATPLSQRRPWRSLGATIPQHLPPASDPGPRSDRSRGPGGQTRRTEIFRRTPGTIAWVMVADTQLDKAGQPLVFLDDRDGRARLFSARADLEQAARQAQAQALALQG
jgi:multidrug efflux pump subunit AcrA (membrane-fusion protein)